MTITQIYYIALVALSLSALVTCQTCHNTSQYGACSTNSECGCFYLAATYNSGICGLRYVNCAQLVPCAESHNICYEPNHVCVHHPNCFSDPVCYPVAFAGLQICPPITLTTTAATTTTTTTAATTTTTTTTTTALPQIPDICAAATWDYAGKTVAGQNNAGSGTNQLNIPWSLFVDDNDVIYVTDSGNNRIVKWMTNATNGQVIASSFLSSFKEPTSMVVDQKGTMFICDQDNQRVQRWYKNATSGQILISSISCWDLKMGSDGSLYISMLNQPYVMKWPGNIIVAGTTTQGSTLDRFSRIRHISVDRNQSVYVADLDNHRVMKWSVGSKSGIVVAGGNGKGSKMYTLDTPTAVAVDNMGTVYVVEHANHRVTRWFKGAKVGSVIAGGNGAGNKADQLQYPHYLTFDRHGNLYVADTFNHRIQMFRIDKSRCTPCT